MSRDRTRERVHDFARSLDDAVDAACCLNRHLSPDRCSDLSFKSGHIDALYLEYELGRALHLAHDLDHTPGLAFGLAHKNAQVHPRVQGRALVLGFILMRVPVRALARSLARTRDLAATSDYARAVDLGRRLEREIDRIRTWAALLSGTFDAVEAKARDCIRQAGPVQPAVAAVCVVERMVRVLPAVEQARYRQEFLAELYDLAEEQASRRGQLGHALRAATQTWSLRRAVRAPRPGRERRR